MENASKALLMAGGILIGLIIISMGVYLYTIFSNNAINVQKQIEQDRLRQFNNKFITYLGKDDLTIYDVINIADMANENNKKYGLGNENANKTDKYYITVSAKIKGSKKTKIETQVNDKNDWITFDISNMNANGELPKYKCKKVDISSITGRVYNIVIE